MNVKDFSQLKKMYEDTPIPHKVIKLSEMSYIGDNVFSINGQEVIASENIERKLDRLVGISSNQREWVQNASDKNGLKNFRNYMQIAYDMHANQEIVLVADPNERKIVDVIPLKEEYLAPSVFFKIVEIFMNNSGYYLSDFFFNNNLVGDDLTLYLQSPNEETIQIADDETFLPNGIFMRWNFSKIEVGNFFTRLACINGAIEQSTNTKAKIHSFNDRMIQQFLGTTQDVIKQGFIRYSERVLFAMKSQTSLAELQFANHALQNTGLQDHLAEEIIPYNETVEKARFQGLPEKTINIHKYLIATNFNMWNIYNRLTTFATHNEIWDTTDTKRQKVLSAASTLLNKKPDIKQFMQII
jgi:hypothetical protein